MKGKLNRLLPMALAVLMLLAVTACNSGKTAVDFDAETASETVASATEGISKTQTEGVTETEHTDNTTTETYTESEAVSEMITVNSTETVTEIKCETQVVAPTETTVPVEETTAKLEAEPEVEPETDTVEEHTTERAEDSEPENALPSVTENEDGSETVTERPQAPSDKPTTEIVTENNKETTTETSEKASETESETERKEESTEDVEITEEDLPWNNGGKLPTEYTASEFYELSAGMRFYFMEWFESTEAFDEWLMHAEEQEVIAKLPWNNGGKMPSDYTASEFYELSAEQRFYLME